VLQVINSSAEDLAPVFDAMLERAIRLCAATFGFLAIVDGETIEVVTQRNLPPRFAEYLTRQPLRLDPVSTLGQVILQRRVMQTVDNAVSEPYRRRAPLAVAAVELGGVRKCSMSR